MLAAGGIVPLDSNPDAYSAFHLTNIFNGAKIRIYTDSCANCGEIGCIHDSHGHQMDFPMVLAFDVPIRD